MSPLRARLVRGGFFCRPPALTGRLSAASPPPAPEVGDSERKIAKAAHLGADVVCLDCEDAVASSRKEAARTTAAAALASTHFGRSERAVRINSVESGHCEEDLRALLSGDVLPDALVAPKVERGLILSSPTPQALPQSGPV